ncbi:2Fe-2S iron-sulfur cluster-binding protein [Rouxiella sp. WC2420]|uniref:2Fe-2S iron-sulfur cluster-binding protein n=1 Tax=Rouxiella sp. WC2420 TaxID=3234145 RepID=A0AB39VWI6_9GAMM
MKDLELIPVIVNKLSNNGSGNISLQLIAQNGGYLPTYSAGAHIDLFIPELGARQYSLCTESSDGKYYEVCVKLASLSSGGSHYIHQTLQQGDVITISAPRNHFPLPQAKHYLLFAGGIGITPLLAMAEEIASQDIDFELHYYVSSQQEAAYISRCTAPLLANNLFLHYSDANDSLRRNTPCCLSNPHQDTAIIACGPEGFIQRLQDIMQEFHWQPTQLSFERFTNAKLSHQNDNQSFYIQLNSSGQRFLVGPSQTIAEVLFSAGADIMLSCEQGICGSCITDVIDGIPDHRDCVLTEEEREENTQITVCCSRSKSPLLVLDL